MGTQAPKKTLIELDRAEYLVNSIETQMPTVSPELETVYGTPSQGAGEGTPRTDWNGVQQENADLVKRAVQDTLGLTQNYRVSKVRVTQAIEQRDETASDLTGRHRQLRTSVRGTYTPSALALVGLDEPPVRPLLGVREQSRDVVVHMRHPEFQAKIGEPVAEQEPLNFEKLANGMETDLKLRGEDRRREQGQEDARRSVRGPGGGDRQPAHRHGQRRPCPGGLLPPGRPPRVGRPPAPHHSSVLEVQGPGPGPGADAGRRER